jgi:uncharacterized protein
LLATRLNELAVVFISIILQSLPFVLVGVFASALVQQYLSERAIARWLPRRRLAAIGVASVFGFIAPVCDCGAIPLGRRLAAKGVPSYAAVTFMLAAPVVNPVVLASTAVAFQGNLAIVGLRMLMTLSVAIVVGLVASVLFPARRARLAALLPVSGGADVAPAGATTEERTRPETRAGKAGQVRAVFAHANAEFFEVIFFIVLGALFTAAAQTLVPRGDLLALGARPIGSILVLMPVATLLSICSEADAFVARAFANTFSLGAVLAFMTIGQVVDLRNGFLLFRTVGLRLMALIAVVSYVLVFAEAVTINSLGPGR